MLFTAAKLVLLNALLSAALPRPGLPKLPSSPKVPDGPSSPGDGWDVPNFDSPNQGTPEPGRWPPESQSPNPNNPADPGTWVEPPNSNQQPDIPACIINGKKRASCTASDVKWNNLPVRQGQTENQYSIAGRTAIARLDDVKTNPLPPKEVQTEEVMASRYEVKETKNTNAEGPNILRALKGFNTEDNSW
jgi:hypothetical protein